MGTMTVSYLALAISVSAFALVGCDQKSAPSKTQAAAADQADAMAPSIHPEKWPTLAPIPLDTAVEARIDDIMSKMTLEQKVGQVVQGDNEHVTPEDVKKYRLGSVLSGGNSAPGDLPYATAEEWLAAADAYFEASIDPEGVEIAIPVIWGIDAVHGHANLRGATIFPHNVGLGAMRNPDLIQKIYEVTARELIVSGHDWTFAPTLAVPRDDRWGRGYEGFSESPDVVAAYGERIVIGLQGRVGTEEFMSGSHVISSAKHYVGDGGTLGGRDQGDTIISEEELRDIHAAGYYTAVPAGVQTVMASYNSWHGQKMHGATTLLTDVLKGRMGFQGFVVGDWNGHGQLPGCTPTDCPQSLNAGLDMYMAPDTWKGVYESTLRHAKDGTIPMARLDDAVRRILRVKIASGMFEKPKPSARAMAGDLSILTSQEHRDVARQAVRESLVLLKNDGGVLPLSAAARVHVIGPGADSIAKQAGGWTLSWQGGGYPNSEFPGGQSLLAGIRDVVAAGGGSVSFDPTGEGDIPDTDVVIAIYGEDPYAEFQGDRENVDFVPGDIDPARLKRFGDAGLPVVSVFLSGRPLWTNPEINASDAFVAAWLPGSEGLGVAEVLFRTAPDHDFKGKLAFSWPKRATDATQNVGAPNYDPQFAFGYGLTYADRVDLPNLSEESGLASDGAQDKGVIFKKGQANPPWFLTLNNGTTTEEVTRLPATLGGLTIAAVDRAAQEDALRLVWREPGTRFAFATTTPVDLSREANGAMELSFQARVGGSTPETLRIGVNCASAACASEQTLSISPGGWAPIRLSLSCFAGANMGDLGRVLDIATDGDADIYLADVEIAEDADGVPNCGD